MFLFTNINSLLIILFYPARRHKKLRKHHLSTNKPYHIPFTVTLHPFLFTNSSWNPGAQYAIIQARKKGLPIYHFTYRCHEDDGLQMGDLTENIFLNATAADRTDDRELAAFLRYVDNGLAGNRFTQELDEETRRVKNDKDWRERIVTWEMDLRIMEKAAEERGRKEGKLEGRREGVDAFAAAVQEKFGISSDELDALKAELATPKDAVKA